MPAAPLVIGGNVFGWTIDEATSFAVLDAFVDAGVTMIDTADVYSAFAPGNVGGESETILGKWMKARGNRSKVQIATKVGMHKVNGQDGLRPETIAAAIDASLKRLQTDHVDLYYAHRDDDGAPQQVIGEAFDKLVKAGKVRALGASNFAQKRLASALEVARREGFASYQVVQPHFNLVAAEEFPEEYRRFCAENGIAAYAYFALASGFLTGKYRSADETQGHARGGGVARHFNARGEKVLAALDSVAAQTGATQAQIALAWIIATPGLTAPIASATSVAQVEGLVPALTLNLDDAQMKLLNEAAATPE